MKIARYKKVDIPEHENGTVCPYACGFYTDYRCRLINKLPIERVFQLCAYDCMKCEEYRLLMKLQACGGKMRYFLKYK